MEIKVILYAILLFAIFIALIAVFIYIIVRAAYGVDEAVEIEQLDFLSWVRKNCILVDGEWYYDQESESPEKLLEIYNSQKDE